MRFVLALATVAALGLAACTPADQSATQENADTAATEAAQAADDAGAAIGDAATDAGNAVEGAVNDAATEVEHATDNNEATH